MNFFPCRKTLYNSYLVTPMALCSANATWNKEAVTVAGFSNTICSSLLASLCSPSDLFVDSIGDMYILDSSNYRILYWPANSTEGRVVAGTGEPGSDTNQLYYATCFASNAKCCFRPVDS